MAITESITFPGDLQVLWKNISSDLECLAYIMNETEYTTLYKYSKSAFYNDGSTFKVDVKVKFEVSHGEGIDNIIKSLLPYIKILKYV